MGTVTTLPVGNLDAAWDRYCDLVRRYKAEPTDRALANQMLDAFNAYKTLYDREAAR